MAKKTEYLAEHPHHTAHFRCNDGKWRNSNMFTGTSHSWKFYKTLGGAQRASQRAYNGVGSRMNSVVHINPGQVIDCVGVIRNT